MLAKILKSYTLLKATTFFMRTIYTKANDKDLFIKRSLRSNDFLRLVCIFAQQMKNNPREAILWGETDKD